MTMPSSPRPNVDRYPVPANLAAALIGSGHPERIAIQTPQRSVTYARLEMEVRRNASALRNLNVVDGDTIGLVLDDDLELAVVFLAAIWVGAVPFIVNPHVTTETLTRTIDDASPRLLISGAACASTVVAAIEHADSAPDHVISEPYIGEKARPRWMAAAPSRQCDDAFAVTRGDALAFIQFTSGSSGQPKGVTHTVESAMACCTIVADHLIALAADDVVYATPKSFFGFGMGASLLFPFHAGATAILDPRWTTPESVLDNLRRLRPTVLFAVPTLFRKLLDAEPSVFAPLRLAFASGAALPTSLCEEFCDRFGIQLQEGYGSTELCHLSAATRPGRRVAGSLGTPLPGVDMLVKDEHGRVCEADRIGQLWVKSPAMTRRYLNRPEDTASRFVNGWFATGDLFSQDCDGNLVFHGRADDRFKVFGRWVSPAEIETLIRARFPEVHDAAVVPALDAQGETRPILYTVVPDRGGGTSTSCAQIDVHIESKVASYKRPVLHVRADRLPLNANGKLDRTKLGRMAAAALRDSMAASIGETRS